MTPEPYIRTHIAVSQLPDVDTARVDSFHRSLPYYSPTDLIRLDGLAEEVGAKAAFMKCEGTRFGLPSFKILGASWAVFRAIALQTRVPSGASMATISEAAQKDRIKLFAATDGNHGRAVAMMARTIGIDAKIFVPQSVSKFTQDSIASEGADVEVVQGDYDTSIKAAYKASKEGAGGILIQDTAFLGYEEIPKYITAGYSTMLREIDSQLNDLNLQPTVIIVPVGVGSLAESVVTHYKSCLRQVQVISVEPESASCLYSSLQAGHSISVNSGHTIMDGLRCETVSKTAWPLLRDHIDTAVIISDKESHDAVEYLTSCGISSCPCEAAPLAALRRIQDQDPPMNLIHQDDVVILLNTEGCRPYEIPHDPHD